MKKIILLFSVLTLLPYSAGADVCAENFAKLSVKSIGKTKIVKLSQASEFVLQTSNGKKMLKDFGFRDRAEMIKFMERVNKPVNKLFRQQMLNKLHEIDGYVATFRGKLVQQGKIKPGKDLATQLSQEEKILVEILGQRLLNPHPETASIIKNSVEPKLKEPKFFLDPEKTAFNEEGYFPKMKEAQGAEKASLSKQGTRLYQGMKECLENQPKTEAVYNKRAVNEALKQVAISEVITLGSYLYINGTSEIRVKDISINLLMTAISNGLGTLLLNGNGTMMVRFIQATAFHESLDAVGAGVYLITPSSPNEYQVPASHYWAFNATWGALGIAAGLPINQFLMGISCLYPTAAWASATNIAARTAYSVGINIFFFVTAEMFLYPKPQEK